MLNHNRASISCWSQILDILLVFEFSVVFFLSSDDLSIFIALRCVIWVALSDKDVTQNCTHWFGEMNKTFTMTFGHIKYRQNGAFFLSLVSFHHRSSYLIAQAEHHVDWKTTKKRPTKCIGHLRITQFVVDGLRAILHRSKNQTSTGSVVSREKVLFSSKFSNHFDFVSKHAELTWWAYGHWIIGIIQQTEF